jgi:signal transduction histidine kinase
MAEAKINVLIIGAGKGGAALLEMFCNSETVNIIGVVDINKDAPGIKLAKELNIPVSGDYKEFLNKKELNEIINVTGSEGIQEDLLKHKPVNVEVIGGHSAKLMWLLIEERKASEDERKKAYDKLKETQRDLIQSEKLAALGRFSTGLAHEVRNPLGVILGGIEYLEQKLPRLSEDIKVALEKIKEAIFRADNILVGLLRFSRPSELKIEKVSIRDLVNEAVSFYKYRAPLSNINIETQFDDKQKSVNVDKNQMHQVIFNILLNAVEAMPTGGQIKIRTCNRIIPQLSLKKPSCVIEIKDTGTGISKENLAKMFEPFFTTKKEKKGTGLGLSVAKTIIENHKGNLTIESELGKGTTVNIILPC